MIVHHDFATKTSLVEYHATPSSRGKRSALGTSNIHWDITLNELKTSFGQKNRGRGEDVFRLANYENLTNHNKGAHLHCCKAYGVNCEF